jgi:hypothetical protein
MMAICPAGPPKFINPNFSQKLTACIKRTGCGGVLTVAGSLFLFCFGTTDFGFSVSR